MDKYFSAGNTGKSCIALLDWFNSSYHLIPDNVLDPFTSRITCYGL